MNRLKNGWERRSLGSAGRWFGGGTPSKSNPNFWTTRGIPWVSPKDMKQDRIDDAEDHITREAVEQSATNLVRPGSVLVVVRSGILRHTLPVAVTDTEVALNQDLKAVELRDDVDAAYFALALKAFEHDILHSCAKGGTTVQNLDIPVFLRFEIPLPSLDEQHRIVAEIEKQFTRLDAGRANLERVRQNLKRYRASVLKSACEGRLVPTEAALARAEQRSYEPASELLARILVERRAKWTGRGEYKEPVAPDTANLSPLPNGWVWATVDELATVVRGASPRPAGDSKYFGGAIPWITVGPITANSSPYLTSVPESVTELGRERSRYVDAHTLLLTNSGATLGVPKITLIGGCINDGVAALLGVLQESKLFLLYFLHTQTDSLRSVNQGAAQPNLNTTIIKAIAVPFPPLAEQRRIVAEVERRLSVIDALEQVVTANLQRATRLRQSILQRAFSGEL